MATRSDMTAVALAGATGIDTPELPTSPRRRLIRRLASLSSRAAGVVTLVPFVPVRARMWAGAVTGVATAIDVALRPRKERPSALAYVAPDEKQITSDPVLFATDAASVLATTAIAATRTVASGTRRVATRQTAAVIAVTAAAVTGVFVTYRFVLRPLMRRRALRDWAESDSVWADAQAETTALPGAEIEWAGPDRVDVPPEATDTAGPDAKPESGGVPERPAHAHLRADRGRVQLARHHAHALDREQQVSLLRGRGSDADGGLAPAEQRELRELARQVGVLLE